MYGKDLTTTDGTFKYFVLFFRENKACHFMWIVCLAEDSHEMSSFIFSEKLKISFRMPSATNFLRAILRGLDTLVHFSSTCYKGENFCDFLLSFWFSSEKISALKNIVIQFIYFIFLYEGTYCGNKSRLPNIFRRKKRYSYTSLSGAMLIFKLEKQNRKPLYIL